jgi:hypothetical protein
MAQILQLDSQVRVNQNLFSGRVFRLKTPILKNLHSFLKKNVNFNV